MKPLSDFCANPLTDLRILDLCDTAGSLATRLLADLGAEVIKIEPPGSARCRPQPNPAFLYENAGKKSITLDITHPRGRSLFCMLAQRAAVVVESLPLGRLASLGLGYDCLSHTHPALILVSLTPFGQQGPKARHLADDLAVAAEGGQMWASGSPSTAPLKAVGPQTAYTTALYAAVAILLARRKAARDNRGAHIDIALQACTAATLEHLLPALLFGGPPPQRRGTANPDSGNCLLACRDGHIQLNLHQQFGLLAAWMQSDGMAAGLSDPLWEDADHRRKHFDHLVQIVGRWTRTKNCRALMETGQLMGLAWAVPQSPADIVNCPQLAARGFFQTMPDGSRVPGLPVLLNGRRPEIEARSPQPGEHNDPIYLVDLHIPPGRYLQLQHDKVI